MNALGKQSDKTRPYTIYEAEKYLNQIEEESLSAAEKKVFLVLKDMIDDETAKLRQMSENLEKEHYVPGLRVPYLGKPTHNYSNENHQQRTPQSPTRPNNNGNGR